MDSKELKYIHNFERFANKAFDLRNAYIISLLDEAYKHSLSVDIVEIWLSTSRIEAEELISYAQETDFKFGDPDDGGSSSGNKCSSN